MTAGRRMEPDDLASFALSLPAVEERETWDHPTFRVRNKMFLTLAGDGSTATLKATPADQTALIAADPETYQVAAYVGRHGWVTVALDRVDQDDLRELVVDAWRQVAPRSVAIAYDQRHRNRR